MFGISVSRSYFLKHDFSRFITISKVHRDDDLLVQILRAILTYLIRIIGNRHYKL